MNHNTSMVTQLSGNWHDITMPESAHVSLEDRLLRAYARESVNMSAEQRDVLSLLENTNASTDPEMLAELQQRTSDYNLHVSLISTLTRKGVSTVETLLRS
ncbi:MULTISPECIES: type III secretion system inner rod subunit SctI [unclassified Symbiopectobacterium]|uniref:type III secretion system inner rod subunit SctI n=2 Tax=Symbiopectobacterium TaxID=801 RepID=UPI002225BA22|nr:MULTISPECIES: type III secretion system inner rod subunit SctI [unclassified Symbiopectobacterium]MCW2477108.1 type III secretion system inner rod subunit SctI [Candidatus Symbiopectobacterium sp. NZEC151]MCW2488546.1 type III secretion system inner rod subunit SctI [Candidatus Symbiopectobacterium sp. NZEC127]